MWRVIATTFLFLTILFALTAQPANAQGNCGLLGYIFGCSDGTYFLEREATRREEARLRAEAEKAGLSLEEYRAKLQYEAEMQRTQADLQKAILNTQAIQTLSNNQVLVTSMNRDIAAARAVESGNSLLAISIVASGALLSLALVVIAVLFVRRAPQPTQPTRVLSTRRDEFIAMLESRGIRYLELPDGVLVEHGGKTRLIPDNIIEREMR